MPDLSPETEAALYPALEPHRTGMLPVGNGHRLYYEESGNPDGLPVICLHGGPGSGSSATLRRFVDPARCRIVVSDQRGAGRSEPAGAVHANTTSALVQDLEILRQHLGIERWLILGGSWGATLALCYARRFPERAHGLVLRAPLLGRRRDLEWFFGQDGVARLFPHDHRRFVEALPVPCRDHPLKGYAEQFRTRDHDQLMSLAHAWTAWDYLVTTGRRLDAEASANAASCAIAAHYATNGFFLPEDGVLPDLDRLDGMPISIVQGERDLVCPAEGAVTLAEHCANSTLHLIPGAGHIGTEPAIAAALVKAAAELVHSV